MKETVLIVCPGSGSYNQEQLGYLRRYHANKASMIDVIDEERVENGQVPISQLDSMTQFNPEKHAVAENAFALTYACALGDYYDIDRERYEIVAVTGHSTGWYTALKCAGGLSDISAIRLTNTMGSVVKNATIGGQVIYPIIDEHWLADETMINHLNQVIGEIKERPGCELYLSVDLGGHRVMGGNEPALMLLEEKLEPVRALYPQRLHHHSAYHTPLLHSQSEAAKQLLPLSLFQRPTTPLIDGKGKVWHPDDFMLEALYDYTLGAQVIEPFYFGRAIEIAVNEFAPDKVIVTGPGIGIAESVAQKLVNLKWDGITDKEAFLKSEGNAPFVIAMGRDEQRDLVVRKTT